MKGEAKSGDDSRVVTLDPQIAQDEDRRLLAEYQSCHTEMLAAADQLSNPRHSMLYPAWKRLTGTLKAIQLKCNEKWFELRKHRKRMRDEGQND
jgi:DNA repair ATPase RecN